MTSEPLPSVSVGFAVYNEEGTIGAVLREANRILSNSDLDYEILVCDDGSTDSSANIIKELADQFPNVQVFNHLRNLGIRATFEHLYGEAKKDFVFINAADKQWDTAILLQMLSLAKKADIIIASRQKKPYGLVRRFISWVFNIIPFVLFGVRTYDAGAVKLVKREIIEKLPLVSKTPFSEAERLIRASRAGYRIMEYPVHVFPRRKGRPHGVKPGLLLDALVDVVRVWRSLHMPSPQSNPQ